MALIPTSWDIDGVDWSSPDPYNVDVINAILLAIRERNSCLYFDFSEPANPTGPPIIPPYYTSVISLLPLSKLDYSYFFTPESVAAGNPEHITKKWIAERFPLIVSLPSAGKQQDQYSEFLSQWYKLLNLCRYVTPNDPFSIYFEKRQSWISNFTEGSDSMSDQEIYEAEIDSMSCDESESQYYANLFSLKSNNDYASYTREISIRKNTYSYLIEASGGVGAATILNNSNFKVNIILRTNKTRFHAMGLNLEKDKNYIFTLEKGENTIPELCQPFSFPTYNEIKSLIEEGNGYIALRCFFFYLCADLSPSYRFFAE